MLFFVTAINCSKGCIQLQQISFIGFMKLIPSVQVWLEHLSSYANAINFVYESLLNHNAILGDNVSNLEKSISYGSYVKPYYESDNIVRLDITNQTCKHFPYFVQDTAIYDIVFHELYLYVINNLSSNIMDNNCKLLGKRSISADSVSAVNCGVGGFKFLSPKIPKNAY